MTLPRKYPNQQYVPKYLIFHESLINQLNHKWNRQSIIKTEIISLHHPYQPHSSTYTDNFHIHTSPPQKENPVVVMDLESLLDGTFNESKNHQSENTKKKKD